MRIVLGSVADNPRLVGAAPAPGPEEYASAARGSSLRWMSTPAGASHRDSRVSEW